MQFLYRQSNPISQMGKPFEGKSIFCLFVATTSSAPQAAACPQANCCLLADKLAMGSKSDVLYSICREIVPPTGSVPAQTLLHRQRRVIPPCICPLFPHSLVYLSRTSEEPQSTLSFSIHMVALPRTEGWQNYVASL